MNKTHPAPWKVQTHNTIQNKNRTYTAFVSDDIGLQFVKVTGFDREEAEDTARLISKSPELLTALKNILDDMKLQEYYGFSGELAEFPELVEKHMNDASAALAQAEEA